MRKLCWQMMAGGAPRAGASSLRGATYPPLARSSREGTSERSRSASGRSEDAAPTSSANSSTCAFVGCVKTKL
jgi:hypothetical protein